MNTDHLRAFVTAVDEGTFEAAAALLRISGSAFSQRIKALEKEVGQVLVTRTVPVHTTPAGEDLLRTARQMVLLEDEARRSLGFRGSSKNYMPTTTLSVAVNADSLYSWFIRVLQEAATWDDVELHLYPEDQEHTHELLRNGTVVAAVAEHPTPVSGCRSLPLGTMRYWPVASVELLDRHRDEAGALNWQAVPVVDYSIRDSLQRTALHRVGVDSPRVTHLIPSVEAYNAAVGYGLGWGMIPEGMMPAGVMEGTHADLQVIEEIGPEESALHWQHWTTTTPALDRLTAAVGRAAARMR
ncbi:ArgP/LysG family DNA-binding transcriptional regulator [Nesterenkonia lacusekhoensis]|uniref:LysR family transcriptional regulator (Chromosome initiation inhibitor) n=1 Tax=Nesterenkonia lacusekhoensis TaxID=150832 RepID=A0ABS4T5H7_9MICC|nr:ArgP/LysG family DNA-binding transcriptional regulator [Nesterenkonia lacusekhoensis]MBP2319415.1 LysR family transcriptional regulator (chromosome initiation inhibitor) [Nesterenkonia lacusekhoensis]